MKHDDYGLNKELEMSFLFAYLYRKLKSIYRISVFNSNKRKCSTSGFKFKKQFYTESYSIYFHSAGNFHQNFKSVICSTKIAKFYINCGLAILYQVLRINSIITNCLNGVLI